MNLRDYLPYYLGCDYWTNNSQGNLNAKTLPGVIDMIKRGMDVRLHLRRLEDMTEEEMIALLQSTVPSDMESKPSDDEYIINMFYADGGNLVDERVAVGAEVSLRCFSGQIALWKCGTIYLYDDAGDEQFRVNDPKAFHYLLRQGFDLFNLIDNGLALDAKTITP